MSFKKKGPGGASSPGLGSSSPSQFSMGVKVKMLHNCFPQIEDSVCEDILANFNWCVEDAKRFLIKTNVNTDDRTYRPRQSKEFYHAEFGNWSKARQNGTEPNLLNNGGCKSYSTPASMPGSDDENCNIDIESVAKSKTTPTSGEIFAGASQDWDFVIQQLIQDGKQRYIQDLRRELENPIFAKALWNVVPVPGKRIAKTMILLRGAPGSGKSTLANLIVNCFGGSSFSADDYFTSKSGKYTYDSNKIGEAHYQNQRKCNEAMKNGISPILIDNTNTTTWEMMHYARLAVENVYFIEFLEPSTRWRKSPKVLATKTVHNVPRQKINELVGRFEENVTVKKLVHMAGLDFDDYSKKVQESGYLVDLKEEMLNRGVSLMSISKRNGSGNDSLPAMPTNNGHTSRPKQSSVVSWPTNEDDYSSNVTETYNGPSAINSNETNKQLLNEETDLLYFANGGSSKQNDLKSMQLRDTSLETKHSALSNGNGILGLEFPETKIKLENVMQYASAVDTLHAVFPGITRDVIGDIITTCNGDLSWTSEILMDGKHDTKTEKDLDPIQRKPSTQNPPFSSIWSPLTESKRPILESTNGSRNTLTTDLSCKTDTPYKDVLFGSPSRNTTPTTSAFLNGDPVEDTTDLFVPTDGEDWFDLQLDKNLVEKLTTTFGNYQPSVNEMAQANLNIRIPPKLAFKLFQYYTLGLMEKQTTIKEPDQMSKGDDDMDPIVKDLMEMDRITSSGDTSFQELVEVEARLWARDQKNLEEIRSKIPRSMATKLTLDELQNTFPSLKRSDIEVFYAMSGFSFEKSMDRLMSLYPEKRRKPDLAVPGALTSDLSSEDVKSTNGSPQTSTELRAQAHAHYIKKTYYMDKLRTCPEKRARVHYSERSNFHAMKMQEYNAKAVDVILTEFQKRHGNENDLDLHQLFVYEALQKLKEHLEERRANMRSKGIKKVDLRVITGRGKNSFNSEPRIAPAVKNFLKSQHYSFLDCNGYILVHLKANEF